MKNVLLIGAGRFGRHIAMQLSQLGHQVMAVDTNEERINNVLPFVTNAQIGDSTNAEFLRSLGIGNFDVCFVTISGNFQNSLETTSLLKELGAKYVLMNGGNGTMDACGKLCAMLEGTGIRVVDLGVDCDADKVVQAVKDNNADIVCLSSLLTTTMMYQKDIIEALKAAGLRDKVKVMVGGAPVTQAFADEIGADIQSATVRAALQKAIALNCKACRTWTYERLEVPGISRIEFYRRRRKYLENVAQRVGIG